ncbi:CmpA/NrtA family ABC transporter substrate-binding protein [Chelatococcus sp. SYSU_G07232]|uniref:CmpA/NrtA family ABC transporter substrate-binding protein n=1 Tax=Chelatococcus albus TaxID=3047466 RepID=A0ABT7AKY3_9HYPH|nr:CmpA/NrtA family ABC transporter substrate-binding protein [Chelatococcus sp. SYSU_G07232]MDJ1160025.1 CmpA/NrtA family ABC transporter substrate-binding protein [Chelatococcus sp. SYSU_G07232]
MTARLQIGFIPLVDAALLVAAREEGFAEEEGLALDLVREASWANIRDKLAVGLFDAAHMLAPAAIATSLGLGHVEVPLTVPVALNLNGNAITVSRRLHAELAGVAAGSLADPRISAGALAGIVARRRRSGRPPLVFGTVFPFSTHSYQLRIWLAAARLSVEEDVRVVVVPPPAMARSLEQGMLDGFCVGAPWSLIAVENGAGVLLHPGVDIVGACPEKVLALPRRDFPDDDARMARLVRALARASRWCADPANRPRLAGHLAAADVLDLPARLVERVLAGELPLGEGPPQPVADYLRLDPGVLRPMLAHAAFLHAQMVAAGQVVASGRDAEALSRIYRPDLFDAAVQDLVAASDPPAPMPLV